MHSKKRKAERKDAGGARESKRWDTAKLVAKVTAGSVAIAALYLGTVAILMAPILHSVQAT